MKRFIHRALVDSSTKTFKVVSDFLAILTIVSIASVVLETVESLQPYNTMFLITEWVAVVFFTLEYIGRLAVSNPKRKYVLSFFGIVDIVSILPTFLGLGNLTYLKSARSLRIIRLLRMMRLAKVARVGVMTEENNMSVLSLNIIIYFATLVTALLITGTAMYLTEPNIESFASIPAGMWWSFKVFMAGIPVADPQTDLGGIFFVLTRFIGLLLLGLLVGVVGNVFKVLMMGRDK